MKNNLQKERSDLAAAFRWAARLNMHEAVANHFSLAVSDDGSQFLLNPIGMHFSEICASARVSLTHFLRFVLGSGTFSGMRQPRVCKVREMDRT